MVLGWRENVLLVGALLGLISVGTRFHHDRSTGDTRSGALLSGTIGTPMVSRDGRFLAVAGTEFRRVNALTGDRIPIDVSSLGQAADTRELFGASMSPDGRYVAFVSQASNLDLVTPDRNSMCDVFRRDLQTGTTIRVSLKSGGRLEGDQDCHWAAISPDGNLVAFETKSALVPEDMDEKSDIYVRDVARQVTERIPSAGEPRNPQLAREGRFVVFESQGQVLVRDRETSATTCVSTNQKAGPGHGSSVSPCVTPDGRYVAFASQATDLTANTVTGMPQLYVRDLAEGTTTRESGPDGECSAPRLSDDGRYLVYNTQPVDAKSGQSMGEMQAIVFDRHTGRRLPLGSTGSACAAVSGDGLWCCFSKKGELYRVPNPLL